MRRNGPHPRVKLSILLVSFMLTLCLGGWSHADPDRDGENGQPAPGAEALAFPVEATILVDGVFNRCEGITFNGEGSLFVAANSAAWRVTPDGDVTRLTDLYTNLGMAAVGARDILVADFGPTNRFNHGSNDDGIVWRVTPEGERTVVGSAMGDPNAILVREDGSFLVSDDATDEIFLVSKDRETSLFTDAIDHPNGMVLSLDGRTLYVAQIFSSINPIVPDDRIWALPLDDAGNPAGEPTVVGRTEKDGAPDGLAMDALGRIYVAANGAGKIYRLDPQTGERVVIAEGVTNIASLVFGQGDFDQRALFGTTTYPQGKVWKIPVGAEGAPLFR